jgi:hypothetical protein
VLIIIPSFVRHNKHGSPSCKKINNKNGYKYEIGDIGFGSGGSHLRKRTSTVSPVSTLVNFMTHAETNDNERMVSPKILGASRFKGENGFSMTWIYAIISLN